MKHFTEYISEVLPPHHVINFKIINKKNLLYSTGHYTQYLVVTNLYWERILKRIYIYICVCVCVCVTESLFCILETNATLQISYTSIFFTLSLSSPVHILYLHRFSVQSSHMWEWPPNGTALRQEPPFQCCPALLLATKWDSKRNSFIQGALCSVQNTNTVCFPLVCLSY